ncbi:MAG: class I SAM-dependent methyltransferase [Acidobacteria bacterium]|jgi:SAM-dependent methyltransferase|nr:class I SAM-dependent methyltransferase [Acidobacteriota bacterium]
MTPKQIQTNQTLEFILDNIASQNLRMLEVGCGDGALAKRLKDLGHALVAVDSSAESIDRAKELGIDARVANFPDFEESPFDVILFTRSLHHIRPLEPSLIQTLRLLKPDGLLIVEDFAFSETHEEAAAWFYSLLTLLETCKGLLPAKDSFGRKLLEQGGGFALWRDHTHDINSATEVREAISQHFQILKANSAPYLYRYVAAMLPDDNESGNLVLRVLDLEKKTGELNPDFLIGRRFVAKL